MHLQAGRRASGSLGKLNAKNGPASPVGASSPKKLTSKERDPTQSSLMKQLQQALADKLVLVRALHQLTSEMATAR